MRERGRLEIQGRGVCWHFDCSLARLKHLAVAEHTLVSWFINHKKKVFNFYCYVKCKQIFWTQTFFLTQNLFGQRICFCVAKNILTFLTIWRTALDPWTIFPVLGCFSLLFQMLRLTSGSIGCQKSGRVFFDPIGTGCNTFSCQSPHPTL